LRTRGAAAEDALHQSGHGEWAPREDVAGASAGVYSGAAGPRAAGPPPRPAAWRAGAGTECTGAGRRRAGEMRSADGRRRAGEMRSAGGRRRAGERSTMVRTSARTAGCGHSPATRQLLRSFVTEARRSVTRSGAASVRHTPPSPGRPPHAVSHDGLDPCTPRSPRR
jgi:hypothetical protein